MVALTLIWVGSTDFDKDRVVVGAKGQFKVSLLKLLGSVLLANQYSEVFGSIPRALNSVSGNAQSTK